MRRAFTGTGTPQGPARAIPTTADQEGQPSARVELADGGEIVIDKNGRTYHTNAKGKPLARAADPVAGKQVYATTCVACHGDNGQGMRRGKVGDANGYQFPPVWGADSYNTGAGMARVTLAAGFIKGNMPSGITHTNAVLTDEQAFDVAAYINSQPRPAKPNPEADFPARKNKPVDAAFPP